MTRISIIAAAVLAVATPALADNDQLAASVGVEPGVYSLSELTILKQALDDNDQQTVKYILDGNIKNDRTYSFRDAQAYGAGAKAQLASQLGVSSADHSLNELVILKNARED
ncbi:hypothetical protein [Tropicimonas sp. IMCC34011]|uniref:hypothetical protein n=1 Tax=Tropicimonas sp. IMCC34011 TaxID=2248759 RepID=UPI000E227E34|nr:hypothetical protein [Tropicimonas sp. IMCC34011]